MEAHLDAEFGKDSDQNSKSTFLTVQAPFESRVDTMPEYTHSLREASISPISPINIHLHLGSTP